MARSTAPHQSTGTHFNCVALDDMSALRLWIVDQNFHVVNLMINCSAVNNYFCDVAAFVRVFPVGILHEHRLWSMFLPIDKDQ